MLRQMVQARMLGLLDDELEEQPQPVDLVASDAAASPQAIDGPGPATAFEPATGAEPENAAAPMAAIEAAPGSAEAAATPGLPPPVT